MHYMMKFYNKLDLLESNESFFPWLNLINKLREELVLGQQIPFGIDTEFNPYIGTT